MKKRRYASGQLGLTLVSESFGTYLAFFYLERLGLSAALYALARTVYALWDAVNDPLFGHLSDRTKTPWGRRRPWLLLGVPLFLLAYLLVFWVPDWARSPAVLPYYFALAILLYETLATVVWTNHGALFPEMFRGLRERAEAAALKRGAELLGLILGIALAPMVYARVGFFGMALLFAGLALLAFLYFFPGIREDPRAGSGLGLWASFRLVLANRAFWVVALVGLLFEFGRMALQTAIPFYAKHALGLGEEATALLFASVLLAALPSVSLWARLAGALGPKRAWLWAIGLLALGALLLLWPRGLLEALPVGVLIGTGFGGVLVLGDVLLAEVIDRDAAATGRRREGVYYSVYGFINRLSGPLQALAFALLTPLFGYVSGENPGPNPEAAFRFLVAVVPGTAILLAYALTALFPHEVKE